MGKAAGEKQVVMILVPFFLNCSIELVSSYKDNSFRETPFSIDKITRAVKNECASKYNRRRSKGLKLTAEQLEGYSCSSFKLCKFFLIKIPVFLIETSSWNTPAWDCNGIES